MAKGGRHDPSRKRAPWRGTDQIVAERVGLERPHGRVAALLLRDLRQHKTARQWGLGLKLLCARVRVRVAAAYRCCPAEDDPPMINPLSFGAILEVFEVARRLHDANHHAQGLGRQRHRTERSWRSVEMHASGWCLHTFLDGITVMKKRHCYELIELVSASPRTLPSTPMKHGIITRVPWT